MVRIRAQWHRASCGLTPMLVHADLRWTPNTGIGVVQSALMGRIPSSLTVSDLRLTGRIGAPQSPLALASALARAANGRSVFWSPGFVPPAWSRVPVVITVHDLTHLHFYSVLHRAYYNGVFRPLFRRCARIICVSDYTRAELLEWSGIDPAKVSTVHNGVDRNFFGTDRPPPFPFPYVLYAGNRRRYKNLSRLIEAFSRSSLPANGIRLVLTGAADVTLRTTAAAAGVDAITHFAGDVPMEQLAALYRGATLVAFVSLYEGFGLPILEAMAAGVPVLTSTVAAMPEVAGDAALLVDPTRVEDIAHALDELATDETLRRTLVDRGTARVARFGWDDAAAKAWGIVQEAAMEFRG